MKLISFEILGFRGYREKRKITFAELTTFVGKNDAGKSSIMDALELFFGDGKIDKDDLCVAEHLEKVVLTAEFRDFPSELVLDATSNTSLIDEHLLFLRDNEDPVLRITKEYRPGKAAEVFVEATAPEIEGLDHPVLMKQAELRKYGRKLGVEESIPAADRNKNPPWRMAIFEHFAGTAPREVKIPIAKDDAKKIWDQVKPHIPYFCLFKVDRASTDQDSEARDPLAIAAKIAIAEREAEINSIVKKVEERATELVMRTLSKLHEMAPELAVGLSPDISGQPKWDGFKTTLKTEGGVPFNKRGSGTKRLVLLNFFRAEAERRSEEDGRSIIYAFEEPESSQHPQNQRLLLKSFKKLADVGNAQVILTTHSPLVAQNLPAASLRLVYKENQTACPVIEEVSEVGDGGNKILEKIATELGVLPDSRVVTLVMVEGPNDVNFFENIYPAVSSIDPNVINLATSPNVAIVPMGGADLKHWVAKRYLQGMGCVEYHIYDRDCNREDTPAYQPTVDQVNNADNQNSARLTNKRETENYLHATAIQDALGVNVVVSDYANVPLLVSDASKQTDLALDMGQGNAKRQLNTKVASRMDAVLLTEIDTAKEVVGWFREITQIVRAQIANST